MDNRITIRLTPDIWKEIERIAKKQGIHKTEVIKRILVKDLIKE